ncbi:uncharacterized protein G2W53_043411 [Senna tora]|uniref:Uncharacterized protein n=1 Tax=Senna tora TaxID=362788 RepID=A0A834SL55_9FABA|nr:uncharacterized protein G2W53_043411 [Senna tora]
MGNQNQESGKKTKRERGKIKRRDKITKAAHQENVRIVLLKRYREAIMGAGNSRMKWQSYRSLSKSLEERLHN